MASGMVSDVAFGVAAGLGSVMGSVLGGLGGLGDLEVFADDAFCSPLAPLAFAGELDLDGDELLA